MLIWVLVSLSITMTTCSGLSIKIALSAIYGFNIDATILHHPPKGHLYVATAMEVQRLPLADCGRYGDTCRECILSRDPYCGWDKSRRKCVAIPPAYNSSTGYDYM